VPAARLLELTVTVEAAPAAGVVPEMLKLLRLGKLLTVVVILLDVAGDPVKQGVAFEVITTLTTSLLANVVVV
jgi:hypothetical protein